MSTDNFYAALPAIDNFLAATNFQNFVPVPDDWYIVITDIVNSTQAIEQGKYKEVNFLGACSITAVLNAAGKLEIPYIFGGDGASILIPPILWVQTRQVLLATRRLARTQFHLDLRVGIVPVSVVAAANHEVRVAKCQISANYHQAFFSGGGIDFATNLIKNPQTASLYQLDAENIDTNSDKADFSGLECRWQSIPSLYGETVSLLILAMAHQTEANTAIYREAIEKIKAIYGEDEDWHPVVERNLQLTFKTKELLAETKIRAKSSGWFDQQRYLLQIKLENVLGSLFMQFKPTIGPMKWGLYKKIVIAATDYKKFDGTLRFVISGTAPQREELTNYLEERYQQGKLVYGLHVSDRALMTCLVFERHGNQVHFVDGADGGYTLAAKVLKAKMKRKAINWKTYLKLAKLRPVPSPERLQK